jgi:hypothetical protein
MDVVESTDMINETYMLKAINMAFTHDKTKRPKAFLEIAKKQQEGIGKLEQQR